MERGKLARELSKLVSIEEMGCDYCRNNEIDEITLPEFIYDGSALGPFVVKNAVVSKCSQCSLVYYSRSEAVGWELAKAVEIALRGHLKNGAEVRFMRETLYATISEFALMFEVDEPTVLGWESGKISPSLPVGKFVCLVFIYEVTNSLLSRYVATKDISAVTTLLKIYSRKRFADIGAVKIIEFLNTI